MFGEPVFDNCRECDCGEKRLIVNKTRHLCDSKNRERLDKNKVPRKKTTLREIKKQMNQVSKKKQSQNSQYARVCSEIKKEREAKCESCGTTDYLSFSHLIPRSRSEKLIAEKRNIKVQCMSFGDHVGCHDLYEQGKIDSFIDREEILQLVKELDIEFYQLKFSKYDK